MSELNSEKCEIQFRYQLLATASAITLMGLIFAPYATAEDDQDRPTVWVELGGQFERYDLSTELFTAPFFSHAQPADLAAMTGAQRQPGYSIGGEGTITLIPRESEWVYSASLRYGRSNSARHLHHQTAGLPEQYLTFGGQPFLHYSPSAKVFGDGQGRSDATHVIVDFKAGKDVGLGLFGQGSRSMVSAGVRFAQFASKTATALHARPREAVTTKYNPGAYRFYTIARHTYAATFTATRSAQAVGPSVSWDASVPIVGSDNGGQVLIDGGINAGLLFGRQKADSRYQISGQYKNGIASGSLVSHYPTSPQSPVRATRARTVIVPNIGGFAGLSFHFPNTRVSVGYRADFFFNAMDEGIGARRSETIGFFGPFASVSIGLGG